MNAANLALSKLFPVEGVVLMNSIFHTLFLCALYMLLWDMVKAGIQEKKAGKILGGIGLALLPALSVVPVMLFMRGGVTAPRPVIIAFSFLPNLMIAEGGISFVIIALGFYVLRRHRLLQMLPLVLISALSFYQGLSAPSNIQWMMVFAAIPLLLYSGQRGRGGKFNKHFFYVFYPAHIYILYMIAWALQR